MSAAKKVVAPDTHVEQEDEEEEEIEIEQQIENAIKELPLGQKIRAVVINQNLAQKKALDEELNKRIQELTLIYEEKAAPLYAKTQEIVEGRIPTEEELKDLEKYLKEEDKATLEAAKTTVEAIPEYWLKAIQSNEILGSEAKEADDDVLKSLTKVTHKIIDAEHFEIVFTFAPNEFFSNTELKKTIVLDENEEPVSTTGTPIEWKEGKNTTVKITKKTQKNKKTGQKRIIEKETKIESFFNFFSDSVAAEAPEEEDEDRDENAMDTDRLNVDYDMARSLIDEVIPYSLEYFLGIKTGAEGEEEDMDVDDLDEDEIEELKKQYEAQTKKKGGAHAAGGAAGADKKDCKQQ